MGENASAKPEGAKRPRSGTGDFFYEDGGAMHSGIDERKAQESTSEMSAANVGASYL